MWNVRNRKMVTRTNNCVLCKVTNGLFKVTTDHQSSAPTHVCTILFWFDSICELVRGLNSQNRPHVAPTSREWSNFWEHWLPSFVNPNHSLKVIIIISYNFWRTIHHLLPENTRNHFVRLISVLSLHDFLCLPDFHLPACLSTSSVLSSIQQKLQQVWGEQTPIYLYRHL